MLKSLVIAAALAAAVAAGADATADRLRLELHLVGQHTDREIEDAFVARSTPGGRHFRRHLGKKDLSALVGASPSRVARVRRSLEAMGAKKVRVLSTQDIITAELEQEAVVALGVDVAGQDSVFRKSVAVPRPLAGDVTLAIAARGVQKLDRKPLGSSGFPGALQTPASILQRYKIPQTAEVVPSNFTQGVAEFQGEFYHPKDLEKFSTRYNLPQPKMMISGSNTPGQTDATEGTLDVEYITAVSGGIATWWIEHQAFDFTAWAEQVLTLDPLPNVVSISWGQGEFRYYSNEAVMHSDNQQFRKLGLRGVSVLVASGDSGPGSRGYLSCSKFMPSWPATSPYVTSVGATLSMGTSDPEKAVFFSGGGFSTVFPRPDYQKDVVAAYLTKSGLPKSSFYNATGRAVPDVAALGVNFNVLAPPEGKPLSPTSVWSPVSGTSCAAPTFAAVISRVNAKRVAAGKPLLGFLNPQLYAMGRVGQDVTTGASTDTDCFGITQKGFPATEGWDAVSGLGTPDYEFLLSKLSN